MAAINLAADTQYTPVKAFENVDMGSSLNSDQPQFEVKRPARRPWTVYLAAVFLGVTLLAPPIILAAWYVRVFRAHKLDYFKSAPIGGNYTQISAKAVDVVVGAIAAPILMACINYLWFKFARIAVFTEQPHGQRAVPLMALIEASITSSGSYDLLKFWTLLRTTRWRAILFGVLTLLAAISSSAMTNIIAYEAFTLERDFPVYSGPFLRLLQNTSIDNMYLGNNDYTSNFYGLDQQDVALKFIDLMNTVSFRGVNDSSGNSQLTNGAYINYNATDATVNVLNETVIELWDVPAYRQTISCEPANLSFAPEIFSLRKFNSFVFSMTNGMPTPGSNISTLMQSYFPGSIDSINGTTNDAYNFVGIDLSDSKFILGAFTSGFLPLNSTLTPASEPSEFGEVKYSLVKSELGGTKATLRLWGISCQMYRQSGVVHLESVNSTSSGSTRDWKVAEGTFQANGNDTHRVRSILNSFQSKYGYHAPATRAAISGIGGALGASTWVPNVNSSTGLVNWKAFAENFLFASAEMERTILNLAITNNTIPFESRRDYTTVPGRRTIEKYRITYVPFILIVCLSALTVTAFAVIVLTFTSWNTIAAIVRGKMDSLRLMTDFVYAIRDDRTIDGASGWTREYMKDWAKTQKFVYEETSQDSGRVVLKTGSSHNYGSPDLIKR